jgi:hypothetical protein
MNASLIVEDMIRILSKRFGRSSQSGKARILSFGDSLTCSINYSKLLAGHKFFYAVPRDIIDPNATFTKTSHGEFVLLICESTDRTLVLPRALMIEMLVGVPTRRVDIFIENGTYILQTTKHPKLDVTGYLNAYPSEVDRSTPEDTEEPCTTARSHVRVQWNLISLGQAEGCSVWVPINDRNLSYHGQAFSTNTLARLPSFGFDENTRRIVQNIDVLWLNRNVIRKAFEIESTTSIYSGLLRMNDLVLAQPNTGVDLHIVAPKARRDRVATQLMRPSFHSLLSKVQFITFESVDELVEKVHSLPPDARISGLIRGEHFVLPENYLYPTSA